MICVLSSIPLYFSGPVHKFYVIRYIVAIYTTSILDCVNLSDFYYFVYFWRGIFCECMSRVPDFVSYLERFIFAKVNGESCDIVTEAIERYTRIIMTEARIARLVTEGHPRTVRDDPHFKGTLEALSVRLSQPCEANGEHWPHLYMKESCKFALY